MNELSTYDGLPTRSQDVRMRRWYNDDTSTCPAFGYIQLPPFAAGDKLSDAYETVDKEKIIKGRSRNDYAYEHRKLRLFAINGPAPVKAKTPGELHQSYPCYVLSSTYADDKTGWVLTDAWDVAHTPVNATIFKSGSPINARATPAIGMGRGGYLSSVNKSANVETRFTGLCRDVIGQPRSLGSMRLFHQRAGSANAGSHYPFENVLWPSVPPSNVALNSYTDTYEFSDTADISSTSTDQTGVAGADNRLYVLDYEKPGDVWPFVPTTDGLVCQSEGLWRGVFAIETLAEQTETHEGAYVGPVIEVTVEWAETRGGTRTDTPFAASASLIDDTYQVGYADQYSRASRVIHTIPFVLYLEEGNTLSVRFELSATVNSMKPQLTLTAHRESSMPIVWGA